MRIQNNIIGELKNNLEVVVMEEIELPLEVFKILVVVNSILKKEIESKKINPYIAYREWLENFYKKGGNDE